MKRLNESIDFTARIMAFIILFAAASAIAGGLSFLLILFLSFHLMPIKAGNGLIQFFGSLGIAGLIMIPFFWWEFKYLRTMLFPGREDTATVPSGRIAGMLKGIIIGASLPLAFQIVFSVLTLNAFSFSLLSLNFLWFILAFIVIFAAAGACLPLKEEPCRRSWIVTGLLCLPLLYLISSLLIVLIPSEMHWRSRFMCDLALGTAFTDKILPRNAREVAVKHKSCVIWITATWSCHVAEKDFLEFARSNSYQFAENDPYHNTNPETNHEKVDASTLLPLERLPESYYFYNYRYRNYGGWVMLYDRKKQILYGHYSSR